MTNFLQIRFWQKWKEIIVRIAKVLNKESVLLRKITLVLVKKMELIHFVFFLSLWVKSLIVFQPFMFRWKDCKGWLNFAELFVSVWRGVDVWMQAFRFEKESCFDFFLSCCRHYSKNFYRLFKNLQYSVGSSSLSLYYLSLSFFCWFLFFLHEVFFYSFPSSD